MTELPPVTLPKIGEVRFKLYIDEDSGHIRARTAEGREIGYMTWDYPKPCTIELCDIMIHNAEDRGHGLGSYLVNALLSYAKETNISRVIGRTAENDEPVHQFYRDLGFEFPYPPTQAGVLFILELSASHIPTMKNRENV